MDQRRQLDQARADLAAVETRVAVHAEGKSDASKGGAVSYAEWRDEHEYLVAERERIQTLVEVLEPEVAAADAADAEAALRKRHAAKLVSNAKLAQRIRTDIAKANSILLTLLRDVLNSTAEDQKINAALPDDLEPLITADFQARGRAASPRVEISSERVWLWTYRDTGHLVGDQDAVEDLGGGLGVAARAGCVKALFDQITCSPEQPMEWPTPLWRMCLPLADRPGFEFNAVEVEHRAFAAAELARAELKRQPREKPVEVELRPVPSIRADGSADDNGE